MEAPVEQLLDKKAYGNSYGSQRCEALAELGPAHCGEKTQRRKKRLRVATPLAMTAVRPSSSLATQSTQILVMSEHVQDVWQSYLSSSTFEGLGGLSCNYPARQLSETGIHGENLHEMSCYHRSCMGPRQPWTSNKVLRQQCSMHRAWTASSATRLGQ